MHILQRNAKKTMLNGDGLPANASYDFADGVWRYEDGLVAFDVGGEYVTKKADIETGEDQKGE